MHPKTLLFMSIAAIVAGVVPVQAMINGTLRQTIGNPLLAAFISFLGGTLSLAVLLLLTTPGVPALDKVGGHPWYLYTGGLLGVVFVTTALLLVGHIGTANLLAAGLLGQLVMSIIIDHFGWLGVPQTPASLTRIGGCLLLFVGVLLIQHK